MKPIKKVTYLAGQTSHSWTPESYLSNEAKTNTQNFRATFTSLWQSVAVNDKKMYNVLKRIHEM